MAYRRKPWRTQRPEQEVRATQNQICQRERAAKTETIGDRAAHNRKNPNQPAKESRHSTGSRYRKNLRLIEIPLQRRETGLIRRPLEQLGNTGEPKRPPTTSFKF